MDIRFYDVIYHLVDDVKAAMTGMLDPIEQETTDGHADVPQLFQLPNKIGAAGRDVPRRGHPPRPPGPSRRQLPRASDRGPVLPVVVFRRWGADPFRFGSFPVEHG